MKINRYRMREGVTIEDIKAAGASEGGSWINKDARYCITKGFVVPVKKSSPFEGDIGIAFKEDVSDWNDYDDVLILDDDFCQPYTPFYKALDLQIDQKAVRMFPCLEAVIQQYNEYMDSLPFLERMDTEEITHEDTPKAEVAPNEKLRSSNVNRLTYGDGNCAGMVIRDGVRLEPCEVEMEIMRNSGVISVFDIGRVLRKLAAYESTGLEPQDVAALKMKNEWRG